MLVLNILLCLILCIPASASKPIDEILDFTIVADLEENGDVKFTYHIDWKVLDDAEYGPLEWVNIGVPNRYHTDEKSLTETIDHIRDEETAFNIYFKKSFQKNEVASFGYSFKQSHLYQIDKFTEGETVYSFTPAWFDDIQVDNLTIKWKKDKAAAWQPDCTIEGDYLVWHTSLDLGKTYTVGITYPNEAFGFVTDNQYVEGDETGYVNNNDGSLYSDMADDAAYSAFFIILVLFFVFGGIFRSLKNSLNSGSGFGSSTEKKIVRTKIEYFDSCPACGAARKEGQESCEYCGKSLIKSKEVVEETQIEHPENYTKTGTYRYGNSSNTFINVHVIDVPRTHHSTTNHRGGGSSCACVSSCACACVSSCACACACASSGRAGCSVKDFFDESKHNDHVTVHAYTAETKSEL